MASIDLPATEADQLVARFTGALWVAVVNSPTSVVLAGEHAALEEALRLLEQLKVFARRLHVDFAFHTPQMEPFRQPLIAALGGIRPRRASIPIASSALATKLSGIEFDAPYWGTNLREPVRFAQAIEILLADDIDHFVEIAPRPVLQRALRQCIERKRPSALITSTLRNGVPERQSMHEALGALYEAGCSPDWYAVHGGRARVVSLPAYPWNRQSHWFVPQATTEVQQPRVASDEHPVLGRRVEIARLPNEHVWEVELSADRMAFLQDHRIRGVAVLPAASYIEMALEAGVAVFGERDDIEMAELELQKTLVLPAKESRRVQVRLTAGVSDAAIQIYSRGGASGDWTLNAAARLSLKPRVERSVAS
jgi:acyl transferase domain-containing protein